LTYWDLSDNLRYKERLPCVKGAFYAVRLIGIFLTALDCKLVNIHKHFIKCLYFFPVQRIIIDIGFIIFAA